MDLDISLIIPHRNHTQFLPRLLDSVLAQKGVSLEVILVDDYSDEACDALVDAYRARGLRLVFLPSNRRIYTREARLRGLRAAQASVVAFADADDALVGKEVLAHNLHRMREHNADLLHFRSYFASEKKDFESYFTLADPFALRLTGKDILTQALQADIHGTSVLWNKLFLKSVFEEFLDIAEASRVRRYAEDILLMYLYYMHAQRYISSHEVGYAYYYEPKHHKDGIERAIYAWYLLEELLPHMAVLGFSPALQERFRDCLIHYLSLCVGRFALALDNEGNAISDAPIESMLRYADTNTLIKVLLLSSRVNAEKIVKATHVLRTGHVTSQ